MLYLLQNLFPPRDVQITCRCDGEGAGAQIHSRLSTIVYARRRCVTYAHYPLHNVAHLPDGQNPEEWSLQWERFFNLGHCLGAVLPVQSSDGQMTPLPKPHRTFLRSGRLYVTKHCHRVANRFPEAFAALAPTFRACYRSTPKPPLAELDPRACNVAIHVRRGDVIPNGITAVRYQDSGVLARKVQRTLEQISQTDPRPQVLHLYSEGVPADFEPFISLGARLHLNEDAFTTFHHLASADVLFVAKSSFSYLAALLNEGICFYEPFWHPPITGWRTATET